MKKAFTLIEVLISIFVLFLAMLGLAAIFAKQTQQYVNNYEGIQGKIARRNAEAYYPFYQREIDHQYGWNIEYHDLGEEYKIAYLTYKKSYMPAVVVVAAYKGGEHAYIANSKNYIPVNQDIIITWFGFKHIVKNEQLEMQNAELQENFVVFPYANMKILDVHKKDLYDNTNP